MNIAVITGASSGMGKEFVLQLDKNAHLDEIWMIARDEQKLHGLDGMTRAKQRILPLDLSSETAYIYLRQLLENEQPEIKILVNSAGVGFSGSVTEQTEEQLTSMLNLNCVALSRMTSLCLPYMQKGSRIIQLASAGAFFPQPGFAVYAASKAYVLSYARALSGELRDRHIYVTAVCPGPVDTPFFAISSPDGKPVGIKKYFVSNPKKVVAQAIKDCVCKKEVSIYGLPMKAVHVLSHFPVTALVTRFYAN